MPTALVLHPPTDDPESPPLAADLPTIPVASRLEQNPEDLLARFYRMMAEAADRGRPLPGELAQIVDALYRSAVERRRTVPDW